MYIAPSRSYVEKSSCFTSRLVSESFKFGTKLVSKMMYKTPPIFYYTFNHQNLPKCGQKGPKILCRNWENRPGDHFGQIKMGSWSQRQLQGPSRRSFWLHMEANGHQLRPLGAHFRPLQVVLTELRGQFLLAKPKCINL